MPIPRLHRAAALRRLLRGGLPQHGRARAEAKHKAARARVPWISHQPQPRSELKGNYTDHDLLRSAYAARLQSARVSVRVCVSLKDHLNVKTPAASWCVIFQAAIQVDAVINTELFPFGLWHQDMFRQHCGEAPPKKLLWLS